MRHRSGDVVLLAGRRSSIVEWLLALLTALNKDSLLFEEILGSRRIEWLLSFLAS